MAAIASYLPQRTDNDIKNYWNTHLKERMKMFQTGLESLITSKSSSSQLHSKSCSEASSSSISKELHLCFRLLEGWMKSTPKPSSSWKKAQEEEQSSNGKVHAVANENQLCHQPKAEEESCINAISLEELENLLSSENLSKMAWERTSTDSTAPGYQSSLTDGLNSMTETKEMSENRPPCSFVEKWLFDEATAQVEDIMNLSLDSSSASIF